MERPKQNPNTKANWEKHYKDRLNKPERVNEWLVPYLSKYIPRGVFSCLEIGCGRGQSLREILGINPLAVTTGLDHSQTALDDAATRINGNWICQDIHQPIEGKYEFVLCSQTLEHVDDPRTAIGIMKGATEPGGLLMITVPYPKSNLDRGVFWHVNTLDEAYFKNVLPGCETIKADKNHLIAVWRKS